MGEYGLRETTLLRRLLLQVEEFFLFAFNNLCIFILIEENG